MMCESNGEADARTVWLLSHFQATAGASLHLFLSAESRLGVEQGAS